MCVSMISSQCYLHQIVYHLFILLSFIIFQHLFHGNPSFHIPHFQATSISAFQQDNGTCWRSSCQADQAGEQRQGPGIRHHYPQECESRWQVWVWLQPFSLELATKPVNESRFFPKENCTSKKHHHIHHGVLKSGVVFEASQDEVEHQRFIVSGDGWWQCLFVLEGKEWILGVERNVAFQQKYITCVLL